MAKRILDTLRSSDTAARVDGDEFAILVGDLSAMSNADDLADRLLGMLQAPFLIAGKEVFVTTSIGIALCMDAKATADELIRDADAAMYTAKSDGKGNFRRFEPAMHTAILNRPGLKADLQHAVEKGQFVVLYQPVVDLCTGFVVGAEALVRWKDPVRGLVSPVSFVAMAEETGLIVPIGNWVMQQACTEAAGWRQNPDGNLLHINVNLSVRQMLTANLADSVSEALRESRLSPGRLNLEITESLLMQNSDAALDRLNSLKALGLKIAIDDFGTGYSSLSYLRRFPVDMLKIDRSFIIDAGAGEQGHALLAAVVQIGNALNLEVLAEGVEDRTHVDPVALLGCHLAQGFFFAKPVDAETIRPMFEKCCVYQRPATVLHRVA